MNELDDRLAGDPVWELFPSRAVSSPRTSRHANAVLWLAGACATVAIWQWSPPLAVVTACLAVSAGDIRSGWQIARSIPDRAGGAICARFTYAWGAWKLAMTALPFTFLTPFLGRAGLDGEFQPYPPSAFVASLLLLMCGHVIAATLTGSGMIRAYRSGMRVWVGEGVNQARVLLLGMLVVVFSFAVLGPLGVWLAASAPNARDAGGVAQVTMVVAATLGLTLVGPIVLLSILDSLSRDVVADRPGKFGPKVPAVGKWD
jgi:hypothetical protein